MTVRHTKLGSVIACEHRYTSSVTGKLKVIGVCPAKFGPEHTRKAIAERERAKREQQIERVWK